MPKRTVTEPELLPPEDDQPKKTRKKLVEAEHTIKYSAPVPVAVEDEPEMIIEDDYAEEIEGRPRRKPQKSERDVLRQKLAQNNVTPASQLKLSIERYLHSDSADGGTWAETEHLTKYTTTEAHITNEDYVDVARKWGAGTYRFTLRLNNKIVTAWDRRIGSLPSPVSQVIQHAIPGDPSSPQIVVQMPDGHQQPVQTFDPVKQMREHNAAFKLQLENIKLMREAFGIDPINAQQSAQPQLSEEVQLASVLLKDPANAKKMVQKLLGDEGEQTIMAALIENGPAIIKAAGEQIRSIIADFAAVRGNNGQTQMASQTVSQSAGFDHQWPQSGQSNQTQIQQESAPGNESPYRGGLSPTGEGAGGNSQQQVTPQDELLFFLIDACEANAPIEQVSARINLAMVRNPELADSLDALINLPIEQLLALSVTLRPSLSNAPHAQAWLESLITSLTVGEGEYEQTES